MDETGMLDYFYGNEAEQFEFLQVPIILVKDPLYHQGKTALNSDAILLYSFMLNRAKLSRKNGWLDEHNRVFIRYAQKEAEEDLHRKKDAVIEAFRKLENVVPGGLIERREVIKGKPYLIYVKNFRRRIENEAFSSYRKVSDIGKTDPKKMITDVDIFFQNSEKPSTTGRIIRLGQVGKTDPRNIYLKNNNTEKDITSIQSVTTGRDTRGQKDDANDMTDEYISLIKKNIGYPEMCDTLDPSTVGEFTNHTAIWRCRLGHEWEARIADRSEGHGCKKCADIALRNPEKHLPKKPRVPLRNFSYTFMRQIPKAATLYYLDKAGETYIQGDDSIIGVPIGLYLPERKTAIEFYKPHGNKGIYYTEEWVKNDLRRRNHITMIRLLEKKYKDFDNCICLTYLGYSLEILDLLIKQLFSLIRIETGIDVIRDIYEIEEHWGKMYN